MDAMRSRASLWIAFFAVIVTAFHTTPTRSQNIALEPKSHAEWKQAVNNGTVHIITKGLGCTCTVIASDMANVLNETGKMRVLPVIGHGSLQGIADVMYLRGIDLSILQADVLSYVKRNKIHENIEDRVRYVTKLYSSELHLIAGQGIETIQDLNGKPVSYDVLGRGSFITAENVFASLGIEVRPVHVERDVAIEKIRQGELAAAFVVTGKPAASMRDVEPGDGLHLLSIPMNNELSEIYLPSRLTHEDYPNLIEQDVTIETIAVPEVLAVYNWAPDTERYAKVKSVVETFFDKFDEFKGPVRHPKWREVDLAADLPGWTRFRPAQEWLDNRARFTSRDAYELKVGDRVIRIRNDKIESIGTEINQITEPPQASYIRESSVRGAALVTPLSIDVQTIPTREDKAVLRFELRLSRPAEKEVAVIFSTIDGTAKADLDYEQQSGVMIIEPGVASAMLETPLINDQSAEGDEEFILVLSVDPAVATVQSGPIVAQIQDDD